MLKLPECLLKDFLEQVTCPIPEHLSDINDTKDVYYLDAANYKETDPQPACLFLLCSTIFALVVSYNQPSSLGNFCALPLSELLKIEIGFGGQCLVSELCSESPAHCF